MSEEVLRLINKDELTQLAVELSSVYGPTGHERKAAEFVFNWMKENGIEASLQQVSEGRCNVVGMLKGTGGGMSLIFNSHLDTSYPPEDDEDVWLRGPLGESERKVWRDGDMLHGSNVVNNRGPMAAFLIAAKAIKNSRVKLLGDLILAWVWGEVDRAPVDEFQGFQYIGTGAGSRHLVHHGVSADFALVGECTNYGVTWVEAGVAWFKIAVQGRRQYTPFVEHPKSASENSNAIVKMADLVLSIEEWAAEYEVKHRYKFSGGTVIPKANIGAIRGGLPYKAQNSAGLCSIYLDVRLPPLEGPLGVQEELLELFKKKRIDAKIECYLYRRGWEGKDVDRLVDAVNSAHRRILGVAPREIPPAYTSMWRDTNVFNEAGIPSACYGPLVQGYSSMKVDDLVNTAKVYALIALDMCNKPKGQPASTELQIPEGDQ